MFTPFPPCTDTLCRERVRHRSRPRRWIVAAALTLIAVVACEDDNPAEPENVLTEVEAEALFRGIGAIYRDSTLASEEISPTEVVLTCPRGGNATAILGVSESRRGDTAQIILDVDITPDDCGFVHDGIEMTMVDGNVRTHTDLSIIGAFAGIHLEGSVTGAVNWALDDRAGDCAIDLSLAVDLELDLSTAPTPVGTFTGTMCGMEVEYRDAIVPAASG